MDLSIECPLSPLVTHSITHDHSGHIAVHALVRLVGPGFEDFDADNLHVKQLDVVIESRHVAHEHVAATPCALGILGKHLPHLVEPRLRMKPLKRISNVAGAIEVGGGGRSGSRSGGIATIGPAIPVPIDAVTNLPKSSDGQVVK